MNINFNPSKKQAIAWVYLTDKTTNFVGYGGAAFSGKSYLMCYWLVTMACSYPDTHWGLGRKELKRLKGTTLITLFEVLEKCELKVDIDYTYNQQNNVIEFHHNKSKIILIDTDKKPSDPLYTGLSSLQLTSAAVDESVETDPDAIKMLFKACGRRKNFEYNLTPKLLECFNPAKNHVYKRYYKPAKEKTLPSNYKFIKALPSDNPSPGVDEYIKGLMETQTEESIQRLVYGNFDYDDDPNALISHTNILSIWNNNHIMLLDKGNQLIGSTLTENNKQAEIKDKYITCDPARLGKDTTVIFVWIGLIIVKSFIIEKNRTNETADLIKQLQKEYQIPNRNVIIDCDGVGGGVADHIPQSTEFNNNGKALNNENYQNIKTQCYYKLAEVISTNSLLIQPNVLNESNKQKLTEELGQVKSIDITTEGKKQILSKDQTKKHLGRSPDLSDCLMLRMQPIVNKSKFVYSMVKIK